MSARILDVQIKMPPNLTALIKRAEENNKRAPAAIAAVVRESAINVVNEAKRTVPIATGAYRDSLTAAFFDNDHSALIGSWLPYGPTLEYRQVDHPVIPKGTWYFSPWSGRRYKSSSRIKMNTNPEATWGSLRKALFMEKPKFLLKLLRVARVFQ